MEFVTDKVNDVVHFLVKNLVTCANYFTVLTFRVENSIDAFQIEIV